MLGILHIGAEKTGTTTLQEAFHLNRVTLSQQRIYYPRTPGKKQHSQLAFYGMENDRENIHTDNHPRLGGSHRDEWRETFAADLDKEVSGAANHDHLLISTELFHSQLISEEEIARVKALLDTWCDEYRIVFYMRRQDRLAVSLYSTRLRAAGNRLAVLPESDERLHYYDYRHILNLWGSVFGKSALFPRIFERSRLQDKDLVADFFSTTRLPVETAALKIPGIRNSALSRDAQTFLYRFNECTDQLSLTSPAQHRRTVRNIAAFLQDSCQGPPSLPSRTDARQFYETYRESNESVAREFFSQDRLFVDDFGMYPEHEQLADSLDSAQTMALAAQVIHHLSSHSLWLDEDRVNRLLLAKDSKRLLDALALYLEETSPELSDHLRQLARK